MTIAPIGLFAGDYHLNGVTINNNGKLKPQVAVGDTMHISAFNTSTLSYTNFITLTSGNPPTCTFIGPFSGLSTIGPFIVSATGLYDYTTICHQLTTVE